ncbi:hypothetical protein ABH955_002919 [Bacillus sp. RC240]
MIKVKMKKSGWIFIGGKNKMRANVLAHSNDITV